jgi:ferritin-like metal-binding protein YciE
MKTTIATLNHVLTFQLEGMYEIVRRLQEEIPVALRHVNSPEVKEILSDYKHNISEQRTKLKRIFGYVLNGPYGRKSARIADAIAPLREISERDIAPRLKDIVLVTSMQAAVQYMITTYVDARYIAMRVELDPVVRLLDEIVEMEEVFLKGLRSQSAQKINAACLFVTA